MKSTAEPDCLTIGQLADRCGVAPHVLRHWETAGLLTPARQHGQRRYTEDDARQVALIQIGRELGLGLAELRELLGAHDATERDVVLRRQRAVVQRRIALAQRHLALIEHGLNCAHPDYRSCPEVAAMLAERDVGAEIS